MKNIIFDVNEVAGKQIVKKYYGFVDSPCKLCGLYKNCINPKIKPYGDGKKGIFILGEAPGKEEDKKGIPFIGGSGQLLSDTFYEFGIDMNKDCIRSNVLQCRPPENKFDEDKVSFCYDRLEKQIKEFNPKLIICFGRHAAARILPNHIVPGLSGDKGQVSLIRGDIYPSRQYNCWIAVSFHPAYILRDSSNENIFKQDIEKAISYVDKSLPKTLCDSGENIWLGNDKKKCLEILEEFSTNEKLTNFDYETNQLSPYTGTPIIYMVSVSQNPNKGYVIPLHPIDKIIWKSFIKFLKSDTPKQNQNFKFEDNWTRSIFGFPVNNWVWDTMLSQHLIDERSDKKNLAFLAYKETGEEYKEIVNRSDFTSAPLESQIKYSSLDSRFPLVITKSHIKQLRKNGQENTAYFYMDGNAALAELEYNGVKIDLEEFEKYSERITKERKTAIKVIMNSDVVRRFEKEKGKQFNVGSGPHLQYVFFKLFEVEPISETEKGQPQVNQELFYSLKNRDDEVGEFSKAMLEYKSLEKLSGTYLESILKYVDKNGILHPTYNLWIARTFRSSCDSPNLQNIPKRDERQKEFRKIFIPRYDFLLEADYKAMEVVVQAVMANDKVLLDQLYNNYDLHRYWASQIYQKPESEITKEERYHAKNGFVFPLLYGSYWKSIAANLSMKESHIQKVEEKFYKMYKGIASWQDEQERFCEKKGYVETPLGFRRHAPLSRNQIVNTPIQATAFHCLLDSLIRAVPAFKRSQLQSLLVLQIHDSLTIDCLEEEKQKVMDIIEEVSCKKPDWKWAKGAPFKIEWEWGLNWLELEEVK